MASREECAAGFRADGSRLAYGDCDFVESARAAPYPSLYVRESGTDLMSGFGKGLVYGAIGTVVLFILIQRLR